jgi:hypothetical protein
MPSRWIVQQNAYKGSPLRAWVRLRFAALDGSMHERQLLADTGSPCAVILGHADLLLLSCNEAAPVNSNFGPMLGAWLQLSMPELDLANDVLGFGSEHVLQATRSASSDFAGLVGLPLLRLVEYGGDEEQFWLRSRAAPR